MSNTDPMPPGLSEEQKQEHNWRQYWRLNGEAKREREAQEKRNRAIAKQPSRPMPIPRIKAPKSIATAGGRLVDELVTWKSLLVIGAAIGIVSYASWWNEADSGKAMLAILIAVSIVSNRVLKFIVGGVLIFAVLLGICVVGMVTGHLKMPAAYQTKGKVNSHTSKAKQLQRRIHKQSEGH